MLITIKTSKLFATEYGRPNIQDTNININKKMFDRSLEPVLNL